MTLPMLLRLLRPILLAVPALLVACTSSSEVSMIHSPSQGIDPTGSVALAVSAPSNEESQYAARELQDDLFGRLIGSGVFGRVLLGDQPADYRLDATLQDVRYVSPATRRLLGIFAGASTVVADVRVWDNHSGILVAEFRVDGESALHIMSAEWGLDDTISEVSKRIVATLR